MKVKARGLVNAIEALGLKHLVDNKLSSGHLDELKKASASWSEIDLVVFPDELLRFALSAAYEVFLKKSSNDIQRVKEQLGTCVESENISEVVQVLAAALQETSGGHLDSDVCSTPINWSSYRKYLNTGIPAPEPPVLGSIDPLSVVIMQMEAVFSLLPQVRSRVDNVNSSFFQRVTTYVAWKALQVVISGWLWELREIQQKYEDEALEACVKEESTTLPLQGEGL